MKKILITISFLLFISGCASYLEAEKKSANDRKLKKEKIALEKIEKDNELKKIDITKFKKESQIITDKTKTEGPSIGFSNIKKPRRALSSNSDADNTKLSGPNTLVSINFNNINLSDGLTALGRLVGRNIVSSQNVQGYLNLQIQNQPWNDVFNSVLEMHKLSFVGSEKGSIIRIYTEKDGMTSSGSGGLETEVFNIFYEKPSEILAQLSPIFPETGDGEDKVAAAIFIANDVNKTLAVQGTTLQVARIENLLNTLDIKKAQI